MRNNRIALFAGFICVMCIAVCCGIVVSAAEVPSALDTNNKDSQGILYTLDDNTGTAMVGDGSSNHNNSGLEDRDEVVIPASVSQGEKQYSVTKIGMFAFHSSLLENITIPASVLLIDERVFTCTYYLTSINVSSDNPNYSSDENGVLYNGVLYNKDKTTLVQYPNGITKTSFDIPASVATIGEFAFFGSLKLESVVIPASVVSIVHGEPLAAHSVFGACNKLSEINVSSENMFYSSDENGVLYNKNKTELIQYPNGGTETSFNIPASVTSIGECAFADCSLLTDVTIPDSVTSTGLSAFPFCSSLISATFEGNAPSMVYSKNCPVFLYNATGFTVYYYSDATGFTTPTWAAPDG